MMTRHAVADAVRGVAAGVWGVVAGLAFCLYTLALGVAVLPMIAVVAVRGMLGVTPPPRRPRVRAFPIPRLEGLAPERRVRSGAAR